MPRPTPRPAWLPPLWIAAVVVVLLVLVTAGAYLAGSQWGSSHAAESRDQAAPPATDTPEDDSAEDADDEETEDEAPEEEPEPELPAGIDPEAFYVLRNTAVDRAIDVSGVSPANHAPLVLWDTHGEHNQQFRFVPLDDGAFEIVARHSDKAIQVGGENGQADHLTQLTSTGDPHQHWHVTEVNDDGVIRLTNDATGRPLVATSPDNGTPLAQGGNDDDLQDWLLVPAE